MSDQTQQPTPTPVSTPVAPQPSKQPTPSTPVDPQSQTPAQPQGQSQPQVPQQQNQQPSTGTSTQVNQQQPQQPQQPQQQVNQQQNLQSVSDAPDTTTTDDQTQGLDDTNNPDAPDAVTTQVDSNVVTADGQQDASTEEQQISDEPQQGLDDTNNPDAPDAPDAVTTDAPQENLPNLEDLMGNMPLQENTQSQTSNKSNEKESIIRRFIKIVLSNFFSIELEEKNTQPPQPNTQPPQPNVYKVERENIRDNNKYEIDTGIDTDEIDTGIDTDEKATEEKEKPNRILGEGELNDEKISEIIKILEEENTKEKGGREFSDEERISAVIKVAEYAIKKGDIKIFVVSITIMRKTVENTENKEFVEKALNALNFEDFGKAIVENRDELIKGLGGEAFESTLKNVQELQRHKENLNRQSTVINDVGLDEQGIPAEEHQSNVVTTDDHQQDLDDLLQDPNSQSKSSVDPQQQANQQQNQQQPTPTLVAPQQPQQPQGQQPQQVQPKSVSVQSQPQQQPTPTLVAQTSMVQSLKVVVPGSTTKGQPTPQSLQTPDARSAIATGANISIGG